MDSLFSFYTEVPPMRLFLASLLTAAVGCGSNTITGYDEPGAEEASDSTESDAGGDDETVSDGDDGATDDGIDSPADANEDTGDGGVADDEPVRAPGELGEWSVRAVSSTEVDAEIYLPDGPGPYPLVLFSPGFQLSSVDYRSYAEHFASWGYITALVNFDDALFGGPTHNDMQLTLGAMMDWFTSDPDVLEAAADPESLVLMGHSMGGKLSVLRASYDARVDAVVGIDPVDASPPLGGSPTDYPSVAPERMNLITAPILLFGERTNALGGFACAPEGENFQAYYESATSPVMEVDFLDAFHMSFVDNPSCLFCLACPAGTDDPVVTKRSVRAITTAFLESEIHGQPWATEWLRGDGIGAIEATGTIATQSKNGF